jgi:spore germination protein PC
MYPYDWYRYYQLSYELSQLKQEVQKLQERIEKLQPIHIDRVEYKIQELQVDTLSGTLNVGLTATGEGEAVEQLVRQIIEKQQANIEIGNANPSDSPHPTEEPTD